MGVERRSSRPAHKLLQSPLHHIDRRDDSSATPARGAWRRRGMNPTATAEEDRLDKSPKRASDSIQCALTRHDQLAQGRAVPVARFGLQRRHHPPPLPWDSSRGNVWCIALEMREAHRESEMCPGVARTGQRFVWRGRRGSGPNRLEPREAPGAGRLCASSPRGGFTGRSEYRTVSTWDMAARTVQIHHPPPPDLWRCREHRCPRARAGAITGCRLDRRMPWARRSRCGA